MSDYEQFIETVDLESKQSELSDLMIAHPDIRANYTTLVPAQVSEKLLLLSCDQFRDGVGRFVTLTQKIENFRRRNVEGLP